MKGLYGFSGLEALFFYPSREAFATAGTIGERRARFKPFDHRLAAGRTTRRRCGVGQPPPFSGT
jgi:hypothetical protein